MMDIVECDRNKLSQLITYSPTTETNHSNQPETSLTIKKQFNEEESEPNEVFE